MSGQAMAETLLKVENLQAWYGESHILHGVGFEIAYALERGKPVLCLARDGVRVSKMLTGIRQSGFTFAAYSSEAELRATVAAFLGGY